MDYVGNLDQVLAEIKYPLNCGNIVAPFDALFDCHTTASVGGRQQIYTAMRDILNTLLSISEVERRSIEDRLKTITAGSDVFLERERQSVLERLSHVAPAPPELHPGSVLILLESLAPFRGRLFGAVQPLVVGFEWGRRITRLIHQVDWDALQAGFEPAVYAAKDYIRRRLNGGLDLDIRLGGTAVTGRLPLLRDSVEGYSIGLGSAIATLSSLLGIPVPADIAFTGRVELDGTVAAVGGCKVKAEAALQKGLRRIVVPASNQSEADVGGGIEYIGVANLDEAIQMTFDSSVFDQALKEFKNRAIPAYVLSALRQRESMAQERHINARRVLLSCISDIDPVGAPPRGTPQPPERGAILTLAAEYCPQDVYIFYSSQRKDIWEGKIKEIENILRSESPTITVHPVFLDSVTDPTDFVQLFPAFRDKVMSIVRGRGIEDTLYYVNVKSGAPQMRLTWYLLCERGLIPQAFLKDVKTTEQAQGGSRVSDAELPIL